MATKTEMLSDFIVWRRELNKGLDELEAHLRAGDYTGASQIMLTITKGVISTSIAGIDSINEMTQAAIDEHTTEASRPVQKSHLAAVGDTARPHR